MAGAWTVVQFGGRDGVDKRTRGLTFREANELMDRLREAGAFGLMQLEQDDDGDIENRPQS